MATATLLFDLAGAIPADGTGSGNNPAQGSLWLPGGTPPTNSPKIILPEWLFDAATDEHIFWSFRMPENYKGVAAGGTTTLKMQVKNKSLQTGTNTIVLKASIAALVMPGDISTWQTGQIDTVSVVLSNNQAVEVVREASLSLSSAGTDSAAAGDFCVLIVGRDADNASDTATGDVGLIAVSLEYTTL